MIARRLKSYLESIPAITNVLSAPQWGVRIRVGTIPQHMPLPYVRLAQIGGTPDYHLAGELGDLATTVQCDVWAETEKQADDIAELIRLAPLSGFHGTWTDNEGNATHVKAVNITSEIDTFEDPKTGSDEMRFRNIRDYKIHYDRLVN